MAQLQDYINDATYINDAGLSRARQQQMQTSLGAHSPGSDIAATHTHKHHTQMILL